MGQRFDIWWNGTDGVKHIARSFIGMWKYFIPACGLFGQAAVDLTGALLACIWTLLAPFIFWLAPLIAIFTAHRLLSDEEVRTRMRAAFHKDGPA